MPSTKCSNCGLVNFATAQFCKRCQQTLESAAAPNSYQTRIIETNNQTSIRPPVAAYQPARPRREEPSGYELPRFPTEIRPTEFRNNPPQNPPAYHAQPPQYRQPQFQPPPPPHAFGHYQPVAFQRSGFDIRLHKQATLPPMCLCCGKDLTSTADGAYFAQKYRWHNPLLYIALISPVIYCILAACLSERFSVALPLCNEHLTARNQNRNYLTFAGLGAGFLLFVSLAGGFVGLGFLMFFALLLGLPVAYEYAVKTLRVKTVEGEYIVLSGASNEFLNRLSV